MAPPAISLIAKKTKLSDAQIINEIVYPYHEVKEEDSQAFLRQFFVLAGVDVFKTTPQRLKESNPIGLFICRPSDTTHILQDGFAWVKTTSTPIKSSDNEIIGRKGFFRYQNSTSKVKEPWMIQQFHSTLPSNEWALARLSYSPFIASKSPSLKRVSEPISPLSVSKKLAEGPGTLPHIDDSGPVYGGELTTALPGCSTAVHLRSPLFWDETQAQIQAGGIFSSTAEIAVNVATATLPGCSSSTGNLQEELLSFDSTCLWDGEGMYGGELTTLPGCSTAIHLGSPLQAQIQAGGIFSSAVNVATATLPGCSSTINLQDCLWNDDGEGAYLVIIQDIILKGTTKGELRQKFGCQFRFALQQSFPLFTTKGIFWPAIVENLLWYTCHGEEFWNTFLKIKTDPDAVVILSNWYPFVEHPKGHTFAQFFVANGVLSCQVYQQFADMGDEVPLYIALYALLTCFIAHICDLAPGDFLHVTGVASVRCSDIELLQEQVQRAPKPFPVLKINPEKKNIADRADIASFVPSDFKLVGYDPHSSFPAY